jgi:O-antigen ligase
MYATDTPNAQKPAMLVHQPGALLFGFSVAVGCTIALFQNATLAGAIAALILALLVLCVRRMRSQGFAVWQILTLIGLAGYVLLNYGFENLSIHIAGLPFIFGYALVYLALALAILSCRNVLKILRKEPAILWLGLLVLQTSLHLVFDLPRHGLWAVRDASMFNDSIFICLGFFWAARRRTVQPLVMWLFVILAINLIYALSFPWADKIKDSSPSSGVFLEVPVFGFYHGTYIYLLAGTLFCLLLSRTVLRLPVWLNLSLVLLQLFGIAIHQDRSMYIGIVTSVVVLVLTNERTAAIRLSSVVFAAVLCVYFVSAVWQVEIPGRVGPVNLAFFREHLRSISGAEGTPGSSMQSRLDWFQQALGHFYASPWVGVGFGEPLIDYLDDTNHFAAVRQPHNSGLSILTRLGVVGLVCWVAFHICLLKRYVYALKQRRSGDAFLSRLILWLVLLYLIFMIVLQVEPGLEFPSGAIPFYFFVGLSLGVIRHQFENGAKSKTGHLTYQRLPLIPQDQSAGALAR